MRASLRWRWRHSAEALSSLGVAAVTLDAASGALTLNEERRWRGRLFALTANASAIADPGATGSLRTMAGTVALLAAPAAGGISALGRDTLGAMLALTATIANTTGSIGVSASERAAVANSVLSTINSGTGLGALEGSGGGGGDGGDDDGDSTVTAASSIVAAATAYQNMIAALGSVHAMAAAALSPGEPDQVWALEVSGQRGGARLCAGRTCEPPPPRAK